MLYQLGAIFILAALASIGLQVTAETQIGAAFLFALLPTLLAIALLPFAIYRAYALWNATYSIERDGLRLQWGLRVEDIPMNAIQWVRPAGMLNQPLPLPWPRWDGAVLGIRYLRNGQSIEFLASQSTGLILIAVAAQDAPAGVRIFAISPLHPQEFLHAYQNEIELGSFASRPARSVQPTAILTNFWPNRRARLLVLGLIAFNLALLIWVSLIVSTHPVIPFRFNPEGEPLELVPGVRLLLLPVISSLFGAIDLLLGLFFYRRMETQIAAYLLWATGLATSILFLAGVYFLSQAA
jgi:hypothetical protein